MSDRENTNRCIGVITNPKDPRQGQRCSRWAKNGSEYCGAHQGEGGRGVPYEHQNLKAQRCVARSSRTGAPCKRPALPGMRVCRNHGGATKASRAKAQGLLDRMVEPVLWELRDIALNPDSSNSDKLRAISMVLDRTLPKEVKHEVEVKPWEVTMQHLFAGGDGIALNRQPSPEQVTELESYTPEDHHTDDYLDDIEDAEIVEEENPRDALWQIRPADGASDRATAQPPRRPTGNSDPLWMTRRNRNEDD